MPIAQILIALLTLVTAASAEEGEHLSPRQVCIEQFNTWTFLDSRRHDYKLRSAEQKPAVERCFADGHLTQDDLSRAYYGDGRITEAGEE